MRILLKWTRIQFYLKIGNNICIYKCNEIYFSYYSVLWFRFLQNQCGFCMKNRFKGQKSIILCLIAFSCFVQLLLVLALGCFKERRIESKLKYFHCFIQWNDFFALSFLTISITCSFWRLQNVACCLLAWLESICFMHYKIFLKSYLKRTL